MALRRRSRAIKAIWIFLGIYFLVTGAGKLAHPETMAGYSVTLAYLIGGLEIIGAAMILAPRLRLYGGSLLLAVMVGVAILYIRAGEWLMVVVPVVMMVLAGAVVRSERTFRRPRESPA